MIAPICLFVSAIGCNQQQKVLLDFSSTPIRFIVNHEGWPRPFRVPRVTEFAIASEEDGAIWQLESESGSGAKAKNLAFVYGEVPVGFKQIAPADNHRPQTFRPGRTYYVAAGGPTTVYRMVFSLPQDTLEITHPFPASRPSASQ